MPRSLLAACTSAAADPEPPVAEVGFEIHGDTSASSARDRDRGALTPVATANPKRAGTTSPNVLSPELIETRVAQRSTPLENPKTLITNTNYGYSGAGPMLPAPRRPALGDSHSRIEQDRARQEHLPRLAPAGGRRSRYDYGTHFLFQGHESAAREAGGVAQGYVTRVNLDADDLHRVTLFGANDVNGTPLPTFDGSTWDPFVQRLLFSFENGSAGGLWQATLDFPSRFEDLCRSVLLPVPFSPTDGVDGAALDGHRDVVVGPWGDRSEALPRARPRRR